MRIVISSGHGKYIRGASGYPVPPQLDEVDCAREVVERVAEYWRGLGIECETFHDNTSHDQSTNLNTIVNYHNSHLQPHDYDVSIHFNAYDGSAHGVECLYVTQEALAQRVSDKIAAVGFTNRGAKYRSDLKFLNSTHAKSILVETCFCDNTPDSNLYRANFDAVCRAIAEAVSGQQIGQPPDIEEPPPDIEQPPPSGSWPIIGIVSGVGVGDRLNVRSAPTSSADKIGDCGNGSELKIQGESSDRHWYKAEFGQGVLVYGWVSQDYVELESEPPPAMGGDWHDDITATQFGGGGDEQEGAYGNYITGSTRGVALPYKWRNSPRPKIRVHGPRGEVVTDVVDVGPWNTDDPDYVLGTARPMVEEQYEERTQAQNGQVPTNNAAIDLTDPIAAEVGISGKGKVSWRIEEEMA